MVYLMSKFDSWIFYHNHNLLYFQRSIVILFKVTLVYLSMKITSFHTDGIKYSYLMQIIRTQLYGSIRFCTIQNTVLIGMFYIRRFLKKCVMLAGRVIILWQLADMPKSSSLIQGWIADLYIIILLYFKGIILISSRNIHYPTCLADIFSKFKWKKNLSEGNTSP